MSELIERVTRLFFEEQAAARKVVSTSELPSSYEAITTEWMTSILCKDQPGAEVTALTLGEPNDGYCNRRRIFVQYNEAGRQAGLPDSVFCKACHDLTSRISFAVTGVGETEVNFYNKIRDLVSIETTWSHFACSDPRTMNSIIVMHDERDAVFFDMHTEIDRGRAIEMMTLLAQFHATFNEPTNFDLADNYFPTYSDLWAKMEQLGFEVRCREGLAAARAVVAPGVMQRADDVWPAMVAAASRHTEQPQTLTHGDGHLQNWYSTASGHVGLHDWQAATVGNGARDVAYILTTGLPVRDRRAWEQDLVAVYAEALVESGGPNLPLDAIWDDYRRQVVTCLPTWTFQYVQPEGEVAVHTDATKRTYVNRITQAMDDLDSLNAVLG